MSSYLHIYFCVAVEKSDDDLAICCHSGHVVTTGDEGGMLMAAFGHVGEFQVGTESFCSYLE